MKIYLIKLSALMMLVFGSFVAPHALADEEAGVVDKTDRALRKGGEATGRGIEKGADATKKGVKKGAEATVDGVKKGGVWVGKGLQKAGDKLDKVFK